MAAAVRSVWARPENRHGLFVETQSTGAEIWQVTTEDFDQSNIYCEVPYCSRDSKYFLYARRNPARSVNRTEFMVVELGTWKQHLLDTSTGLSGCAIRPDGAFEGSTLGRLDAESMFYLRSRGIDEKTARAMLTWAFANVVVEEIELAPIRALVRQKVFEHLPAAGLDESVLGDLS